MKNSRYNIMLVDDDKATMSMGRNMLKTFYKVYPVPSAVKFFEIIETILPDLVLLDINMPEMNGYETIKKFKADQRFMDIPVIFLTVNTDEDSELEGLNLGAVDYITKPLSGPLLLKRIATQLSFVEKNRELLNAQATLKTYTNNLEEMVRGKTKEVTMLQHAVLTTVADLVEFRDKHTGGHIARTQHYLKALTDELIRQGIYTDEFAAWDMDSFLSSALLHDVGKIGISDLILNKPGKLTPSEFEIMKTHVAVGVQAIEKILLHTENHIFLHHALLTTGSHHEKWDGSGYPMGLKGKNIPLEGRLMALADVYDALISTRPYKKKFTRIKARKIIEEGAGTHFDPILVDVFRKVEDTFARAVQTIQG
ncbi:MAG: response regulator [Betaproteobacteria bacterium]|nr:response regulator [Betaproteobacteria bacterium]